MRNLHLMVLSVLLRRFDLRPKRRQAMARQTLPLAGAIFALDLAEPDGCRGLCDRKMQLGNRHGCLPEISHPPTNRGRVDRVPAIRGIAGSHLACRSNARSLRRSARRRKFARRLAEDSTGL